MRVIEPEIDEQVVSSGWTNAIRSARKEPDAYTDQLISLIYQRLRAITIRL